MRLRLAVPVRLTYWPAGQSVNVPHEVWLGVAVNVPLAHATHVWLLVGVPATVTEVPAGQTVHGRHALELGSRLYELAGHALQLRSVVAEPETASVPAAQSSHAMQAVPGLPS
jgi:hypothetical protein